MIRKYTYIKTEPTHLFSIARVEKIAPTLPLPSSFSLYNLLSPVKQQGELGSCTACCLTTAVETLINIYKIKPIPSLSRLFLYFNERKQLGLISNDYGSSLSVGITCLQNSGVCIERFCPYNIIKFREKPSQKAYINAHTYKIKKVIQLQPDINQIKTILTKFPIVIAIMIYKSFEDDSVTETGIITHPDVNNEELLGGHAMCIYGYDDEKQCVFVRNSWGKEWGDNGNCYLPYSYLLNESLIIEMWACVSFKNLKLAKIK
jgi:C1A family cysteine protease